MRIEKKIQESFPPMSDKLRKTVKHAIQEVVAAINDQGCYEPYDNSGVVDALCDVQSAMTTVAEVLTDMRDVIAAGMVAQSSRKRKAYRDIREARLRDEDITRLMMECPEEADERRRIMQRAAGYLDACVVNPITLGQIERGHYQDEEIPKSRPYELLAPIGAI